MNIVDLNLPEASPVKEFTGQYRFLSNFYPSPIMYEGIQYPTVEHAYQAQKTSDPALRAAIAALPTPGQAKRKGRRLRLRDDWEQVKVSIMLELCRLKFQDPDLKRLLDSTKGRRLLEGNSWGDTFWGVVDGKGNNFLGNILMMIRDKIPAG